MEEWKERALYLARLQDEFENHETEPLRKSQIAWELLRDKVEQDHGLMEENKQFNEIQIDYTLKYIKYLMKSGATLGLLARDIVETLGDERFSQHQ